MAIAWKWAAALSAGAVALATQTPPFVQAAQAADSVAFTIPAEDGYGIADCMISRNRCGQEIADAWCAEHGRTRAVAFGAADVTGDIPRESGPAPEPGAVIVRCD